MSDTGASFGGSRKRMKDVGGTPGGLAEFLVGAIMAAVGLYLVFTQTGVHMSYWRFAGGNSFGLSLIPLVFGIGVLFFNGNSVIGWVLTVGGVLFILAGILLNLNFTFRHTSLMNAIIMFGLIAGGLGLVFRSLRPHRIKE